MFASLLPSSFSSHPSVTAIWILSNNTDCNLPFTAFFWVYVHSTQQQVCLKASQQVHQLQTVKVGTVLSWRYFQRFNAYHTDLFSSNRANAKHKYRFLLKITRRMGEDPTRMSLTWTSLSLPLCFSSQHWKSVAYLHMTLQNQCCL